MKEKNDKSDISNEVKIESGIPLPMLSYTWENVFRKMKAGDSFLVNSLFKTYTIRNVSKKMFLKITMKKTSTGYRVWLIGNELKKTS